MIELVIGFLLSGGIALAAVAWIRREKYLMRTEARREVERDVRTSAQEHAARAHDAAVRSEQEHATKAKEILEKVEKQKRDADESKDSALLAGKVLADRAKLEAERLKKKYGGTK